MTKASENDTKKPLISVIVPVYNVKKFLDRCIESIANQTYKNLEIILINDGSTDGSQELCKKWQEQDKRIILLNQKNKGQSAARNQGIKKSNGLFLTFIDSDDYVEPNYIETLYYLLSKYKASVSVCSHYIVYPKKTFIHLNAKMTKVLNAEESVYKMMYGEIDVSIWGKLYRKDCFKEIRYPENKSYEDAAITPILFANSTKIVVSPQITYYYVINENSVTTSKNYAKKMELIEVTQKMGAEILKKYPKLKKAVNRRIMYAYLSTLSQFALMNNVPKKYIEQVLNYIKKNAKEIQKDKEVPKRDQLGIKGAKCGFSTYKLFWKFYLTLKRQK